MNSEAILVHVYGYSQDGKRPNLRARLNVAAAHHLHDTQGVSNFVVAGGRVLNPDFDTIAEVTAEELRRKLPKRAKIIALPSMIDPDGQVKEVRDTTREIDVFLSTAQEHGWTQLASLADRVHIPSIMIAYRNRRQNVHILSSEQVLGNMENRYTAVRYRWFFDRLQRSNGEFRFMLQEFIKCFAYLAPGGEAFIRRKADTIKSKPQFDR
jgi:hypothetical protein